MHKITPQNFKSTIILYKFSNPIFFLTDTIRRSFWPIGDYKGVHWIDSYEVNAAHQTVSVTFLISHEFLLQFFILCKKDSRRQQLRSQSIKRQNCWISPRPFQNLTSTRTPIYVEKIIRTTLKSTKTTVTESTKDILYCLN